MLGLTWMHDQHAGAMDAVLKDGISVRKVDETFKVREQHYETTFLPVAEKTN